MDCRAALGRPALQEAGKALARVGLADSAGRNATSLSGGQQQRLALARAWSLQPDVLLLDEPTASLDPHAKREVEKLMAEFAAAGMTLVFASHNLGQNRAGWPLASSISSRAGCWPTCRCTISSASPPPLEHASPEAEVFLKGELA